MKMNNNSNKYKLLRKKFPFFIYENFTTLINSDGLKIEFCFNLSDKYFFKPVINIPNKEFYQFKNYIQKDLFENIIFNIGMIELISYWKCACPPLIIIKPYILDEEQISWWKKIYFHGLGEFFYLNSIEAEIDDFVKIKSDSEKKINALEFKTNNSVIVPIGGGKDSVVTLEILSKNKMDVLPMIINPNKATLGTIETAGFSRKNIIEVQRTIAPKLLELNDEGFLNGHTPFSALLAFVSLLTAFLTDSKNIALSNESSANEPTLKNSKVNHQYSKSFEFETDFRNYVKKFISPDFNYFSFLRPLNELQIAKLFSGFLQYFNVFRSCNVGSKTNQWCGKCPKCLFVYIILSPFVSQNKLVEIFGKNLFEDEGLMLFFNQLIGKEKLKPFECVGTVDEVNLALSSAIKKYDTQKLPYLLKYYSKLEQFEQTKNIDINVLLKNFNDKNHLGGEFEELLKS